MTPTKVPALEVPEGRARAAAKVIYLVIPNEVRNLSSV